MRRYTIEFVREQFEKEGYILLSTAYVNSKTPLKYICPNGHHSSILWCNWTQGKRCKYCANNVRYDIDFIRKKFEKEGYTLLTKKYINASQKLEYICPKGHHWHITWGHWREGVRCRFCYLKNNRGENHPKWVGGTSVTNYNSYAHKLSFCEDVRRAPNNRDILEVKCAYCGKWFKPTVSQTKHRLSYTKNNSLSEGRFYCSENCKCACPIFNQKRWPRGFKKATSREVTPLLRQLVLKRDDYTCQMCGITSETAELHVHHILSYKLNKMQANDPDNCVTLCKKCHKLVHAQYGCRYSDLKCKKDKKSE